QGNGPTAIGLTTPRSLRHRCGLLAALSLLGDSGFLLFQSECDGYAEVTGPQRPAAGTRRLGTDSRAPSAETRQLDPRASVAAPCDRRPGVRDNTQSSAAAPPAGSRQDCTPTARARV